MPSRKMLRDASELKVLSVHTSKKKDFQLIASSRMINELTLIPSQMPIRERLSLRHRRTHIFEPMHVGSASMPRWKSCGFVGSHGIVLDRLGHSRVVSSRLQQRTQRWTRVRFGRECVQLHMSDETHHVWAGSRKLI